MITVWKEPGYDFPGANAVDRIGLPFMRRFQAEAKEKMFSDAYGALREKGQLCVAADKEWAASEVVAEIESYGFKFLSEFDHKEVFGYLPEYGVQTLLFQKPESLSARDYILSQYTIEPDWTVLDVGPGNYPLARADAYLETGERLDLPEYRSDTLPDPKKIIWGSIEDPLLIEDWNREMPDELLFKKFDFVWASHVLEHVDDPKLAAYNLSRLGKRGVVVCPSYVKEALFLFEERDHKWDVLPPAYHGGPMRFVRPNMEWRNRLRDRAVTGSMGRVLRTGPPRTNDHRVAAAWYRKVEPLLDIHVAWEGELKVQVIE